MRGVPQSQATERRLQDILATPESFRSHLVHLNALVRGLDPRTHSFCKIPSYVEWGQDTDDVGYYRMNPMPAFIPGLVEHLRQGLTQIQDPRRRAELSFFSVNFTHPFDDGNGRLARMSYEIFRGEISTDPRYYESNVRNHPFAREDSAEAFTALPRGSSITMPAYLTLAVPELMPEMKGKLYGGVQFLDVDLAPVEVKQQFVRRLIALKTSTIPDFADNFLCEFIASRHPFSPFKLALLEMLRNDRTMELADERPSKLPDSIEHQIPSVTMLLNFLTIDKLRQLTSRCAEITDRTGRLMIDCFVKPDEFQMTWPGYPKSTVYDFLMIK